MSRRTRFGASLRNHRHIDRHAEIVAGRTDKASGDRNCLPDVAGDSDAYQVATADGPMGWVVCDPAGAWQVDIGPGMCGPAPDGGGVAVVGSRIVEIPGHDPS